jgi:hypothetical protein
MEAVIQGIMRNDYEFKTLTEALKDEKQRPFLGFTFFTDRILIIQ